MAIKSEIRYNPAPHDFKNYDTQKIREQFLINDLFIEDQLNVVYTHYDRMVVAGTMPVKNEVKLLPIDYMKTEFFNMRRETGVINVGGSGKIFVDGEEFSLNFKEALYTGLGTKDITFKSDDDKNPAKFYINSCLAFNKYPAKKVSREEANPVLLGEQKNTSKRSLNQYIVPGIVETDQLMMGITEVFEGNAWNTMPCHVHTLRMEAYFYFEIPEDETVCHFMGQPQETRHIWLQNDECVLSPDWSIHSAAGTHNYSFIWGMAGSDSEVDPVAKKDLK